MKVFISWSGPRSHAVGAVLNEWLPLVIQAIEPFFSPEMEKGAKWSNEIDGALEGISFGIVCLAPDNLKSEWVHFEAGALSKTGDARIWTFLIGLKQRDVPPPLGKFQHTVAEKSDVLRLMKAINSRLAEVGDKPLLESRLEETFEMLWPKLEEKILAIEKLINEASSGKDAGEDNIRDQGSILGEILELVRSQERRLSGIEETLKIEHRNSSRDTKRSDLLQKADIPILAEEPDAETIAEKISTSIIGMFPGSVSMVKRTDKGYSVEVILSEPASRQIFAILLGYVCGTIGYKLKSWSSSM